MSEELQASPTVSGVTFLRELCDALHLPHRLKIARVVLVADAKGVATVYVKRFLREDELQGVRSVLVDGKWQNFAIHEANELEIDETDQAVIVDGNKVA